MLKRYFIIINLIYAIMIPLWLITTAAVLNFELGFSWKPQEDIFISIEYVLINMIFLFTSSILLSIIGVILLRKHLENKKEAPLLLGTYNLIASAGLFIEGIRKYTNITEELFRVAVEAMIFIFVSWAFIYLFLFLQEIFTGDFSNKKHLKSHLIFGIILSIGDMFFMGVPQIISPSITLIIAYVFLFLLIMPTSVWQMRASYRLTKKSSEKRVKRGILMIGFSALFYFMIFIAVPLKKLLFSLDIVLSILIFGLSLTTYLGYIYPSRAVKKAGPSE